MTFFSSYLQVCACLTLCVCAVDSISKKESQLKLVHLIWRHGDRNPDQMYPSDPYASESFWPGGYGSLTETGMMQQKYLGRYLRERYEGFIKPVFDPKEVYVESSSVNRTVMSAQFNLQGLFDFEFKGQLGLDSSGFPIPIHIIPHQKDNKIGQDRTICPRWIKLYNEVIFESEIIKSFKAKNQAVWDYVANHTRTQPYPDILSYIPFQNLLYVESLKNYTLPEWTKTIFPGGVLDTLPALCHQVWSYTDEMTKFRSGPIMKEMLRHMKFTVDKRPGTKYRKMYAYSGHDLTIASVLIALGAFEPHNPDYASVLMMELRKNVTSTNYFVDVLYRNDTRHEPYVIHPRGCPTASCDFKIFYNLFQRLVPKNWDLECQLR